MQSILTEILFVLSEESNILDYKLYTAKTGEGASEILKKLEKKQPDIIPEVAFIPTVRTRFI